MGNRTSTQTAEPEKKSVFTNTVYRIPALIYINDEQTFLAFAEKRTSPDDADATLLVLSRGKQLNGSITWSDVQELTSACLPGYRTMNPCPVYEKESKTVFLFFNSVFDKVPEQTQITNRKNQAKLCYVTSKDGGQNWSDTTDLTERVIGSEIKNWATFSVGPGHGIQMTNGRLIIPAYVYYICYCKVKPRAFAFYSDDRGSTWRFGEKIPIESTECEMAEITDDKGKSYLYCNARSPNCYRVEAWSQSSGEVFEKYQTSDKLVEPKFGCQGSVVSFAHGNNETWLLFSHTTDQKVRKNLGVYLNKTSFDPNGWSKPYIINHGVSGYSDMTQCDKNDRFACLFERGTSQLEEIDFAEFSLSDILKNH